MEIQEQICRPIDSSSQPRGQNSCAFTVDPWQIQCSRRAWSSLPGGTQIPASCCISSMFTWDTLLICTLPRQLSGNVILHICKLIQRPNTKYYIREQYAYCNTPRRHSDWQKDVITTVFRVEHPWKICFIVNFPCNSFSKTDHLRGNIKLLQPNKVHTNRKETENYFADCYNSPVGIGYNPTR